MTQTGKENTSEFRAYSINGPVLERDRRSQSHPILYYAKHSYRRETAPCSSNIPGRKQSQKVTANDTAILSSLYVSC